MEWIAGVEVGTMNNASGAAGYTDFTSITCDLTGGNNVNVTLTPGFSGSTYTEYWKIWIDYNNDHDFEDAGEEVFSGYGSSVVSGSFTVASGIDVVTRMRVSMKYAGYPTPCETFTYGEVEDYTANVYTSGTNYPPAADFTYTTNCLTANFTDTSTDPNGASDIVSWNWDFGDGNTSTEQNPSHTYAAEGTYTVSLTVTDSGGLSDTTGKNVTVTDCPTVEIFVNDITQTPIIKGRNYESSAVVTIWDTNNNPVADATVYITWSGVVGGTDSGVTAADGTVTFVSDKLKSNGPFIITVDNVTHAVHTYNSSFNVEITDSATF
jgi:PKD repeat protein